MTSDELRAKADALDAEAQNLRRQAIDLRQQELAAKPIAGRIVYAADSRCPCGLGLAYDPLEGPQGAWDCSGIILGAADKAVKHTARLPFVFYEIKGENQPSACGRTTRPAAV